jgi:hypothetical protein
METFTLTQGQVALIDDDDFDRVNERKWQAQWKVGGCYAVTKMRVPNIRHVSMHRLIMGEPIGLEIDHINMRTLDNRKCNLRIVTRLQNRMNKGKPSNNTSGFKGVCFIKKCGRYRATILVNGKLLFMGYFKTATEAAYVHDEAARKYHGVYGRYNFPREGEQQS